MIETALQTYFPQLAIMPELKKEIANISSIVHLEKGTVFLKEGSYVKVIPLLIQGLAKVYKEDENGHEVLLYYIKPGESCITSVTLMNRNEASNVKAIIEEDAEVVVIPTDKALKIAQKYPKWNEFIYELFSHKFLELINVIKVLTFSNKDTRLLEYLKKAVAIKGSNSVQATHQQIADDLGSSREVISRLLKKLEHQGLVRLQQGSIELL